MYVLGKKFYSYCVEPNFYGRYFKFYPLDELEYKMKKKASLKSYEPIELSKQKYDFKAQRENILKEIAYRMRFKQEWFKMDMRQIAYCIGIGERSIARWIKEYRKEQKKDEELEYF